LTSDNSRWTDVRDPWAGRGHAENETPPGQHAGASFDVLLEASGFRIESQEDFEAITDAEWEKVIQSHTSFASWREMQEKAGEEYATRKLTEGL
jgi:hypothetical protein